MRRQVLNYLSLPNSGVCVGIDPDPEKFPINLVGNNLSAKVKRFSMEVVDITCTIACSYKIQKAFFDPLDDGKSLIVGIVDYIHRVSPKTPVFIDCKIGDTGNTMKKYLENILGKYNADGVVVNPYMGDEVFDAFKNYSDRAILPLIRTSNFGSSRVQSMKMYDGREFWEHILDLSLGPWNEENNIIPILSGYADLNGIREIIPNNIPVLYAGVGAQGGDLSNISHLLNSKKSGVFVNSSRGILYPYKPDTLNWRSKVYDAAKNLENQILEIKNAL